MLINVQVYARIQMQCYRFHFQQDSCCSEASSLLWGWEECMCDGGETNDGLASSVPISIMFPTLKITLTMDYWNRSYRKQCRDPCKWRLGQLWRIVGL